MSGMIYSHSDLGTHYTDFTPKQMTILQTGQQAVTACTCIAYSSPLDSIGLPDTEVVLQS